jgi:hypothetical protein
MITNEILDEIKRDLIQDNHAEDGEGRYGSTVYDLGVRDAIEAVRAELTKRD